MINNDDLRKMAEKQLRTRLADIRNISIDEVHKMVYELQVHKIELEMQNHELRNTQLQLEASNKKYLELYDFAPVGYLSLDEVGLIVNINLTAAKQLGLEKNNLINKQFFKFVVKEDCDKLYLFIRDVLKNKSSQSIEIKLKHEYGNVFDAQLNGLLCEDSNGKKICITSLTDITSLKDIERELIITKTLAEDIARIKSNFLSVMSHEMRTPLNGIIGFTELLNNSELSQEQSEYANYIKLSSESLLHIINQVLNFSKAEAGKVELCPVNFSLRAWFKHLMKTFDAIIRDKNIKLTYDIDTETPDNVLADKHRLNEIMSNLISNAIKFTHHGEIKVNLKKYIDLATSKEKNKIMLHGSVQDTGIGIPIEKQEAIFVPFTQADSSMTRIYGGTGLGLSITKKLIELMEGRIWFESQVERGTTFHFTVCIGLSESI